MPSIYSSMNIENLEQLDDRVVAIKKNKTHLSHSKEGFLIRNQHKKLRLKLLALEKLKLSNTFSLNLSVYVVMTLLT